MIPPWIALSHPSIQSSIRFDMNGIGSPPMSGQFKRSHSTHSTTTLYVVPSRFFFNSFWIIDRTSTIYPSYALAYVFDHVRNSTITPWSLQNTCPNATSNCPIIGPSRLLSLTCLHSDAYTRSHSGNVLPPCCCFCCCTNAHL